MLDQVIEQHQDSPHIHIGCDEVYYKLINPNCLNSTTQMGNDFQKAFLK